MQTPVFYPTGSTKACAYATRFLEQRGFTITDHPSPDVTDLLLDIPSFRTPGILRSGEELHTHLVKLPERVRVIGGNLGSSLPDTCRKADLLQDPEYLAKNAFITAWCAMTLAAQKMSVVLPHASILVIGWGRIGKCLAQLMRGIGADPLIAVRKESDRAILTALGYRCVTLASLPNELTSIQLILNTAPAPVLREEDLKNNPDCLKIDLASQPGLLCRDVIHARGLPGLMAPESSGLLIADTVCRLTREETL